MTDERYTLKYIRSWEAKKKITPVDQYAVMEGDKKLFNVLNIGGKKPTPTPAQYYSTYTPCKVIKPKKTDSGTIYRDILEACCAPPNSGRSALEGIYYTSAQNIAASTNRFKLAVVDNADQHLTLKDGINQVHKKGKPEGRFPDFLAIIPRETNPVTVVACELLNAVQCAMVFARDSANSVRLFFNPDSTLSVRGRSAERGDCETVLDYSGNMPHSMDCDISVNGEYLLDVLKPLAADTLLCIAPSNTNPIVVTLPDYPDITVCIMPMSR